MWLISSEYPKSKTQTELLWVARRLLEDFGGPLDGAPGGGLHGRLRQSRVKDSGDDRQV